MGEENERKKANRGLATPHRTLTEAAQKTHKDTDNFLVT
jgi:hypothetical protein